MTIVYLLPYPKTLVICCQSHQTHAAYEGVKRAGVEQTAHNLNGRSFSFHSLKCFHKFLCRFQPHQGQGVVRWSNHSEVNWCKYFSREFLEHFGSYLCGQLVLGFRAQHPLYMGLLWGLHADISTDIHSCTIFVAMTMMQRSWINYWWPVFCLNMCNKSDNEKKFNEWSSTTWDLTIFQSKTSLTVTEGTCRSRWRNKVNILIRRKFGTQGKRAKYLNLQTEML